MLRKLLRLTAITAAALLLLLFALVQLQQHHLRHQAEQLHADILALQIHPGTFTDLQRLQTRWGAHAHYDGECTPHHCIYEIKLLDPSLGLFVNGERLYKLLRPYRYLGGRSVEAHAILRIRDNRM